MTLALLLTAVGGAWAQAPTIYFQQDYTTETVDWSTGTAGRYTPIIEDGYLTVTQNQRQNNGTTLTCTATQGKVEAGKDFTMTFNVKLGASNNRTETAFNIYDGSNSGLILSLAEGSAGATAWKINGGTQTATVSAGGGKSLNELSWIFIQVTSIAGGKTYLTLKDDQNNIIDGFDKTEIPTLSVAGGLGKMTFVTSRYFANFAIDNVLVRDVEPEPTEWSLTPDADKKVWTLANMPASNVELQVEYEPTKVTMAANDNAMGTVEVCGESKVEWTADTWKGWTYDTKEYTVDDITMTSSKDAYIRESTEEGKYKNSLSFGVIYTTDQSTVTFSTTGDPFSRIEFTMLDDYSESNPNNPHILPVDNWTFEGKSAVWEGEATKSLTLQSCSTNVSKITFFKGAIPDGVTVNDDGTFTVAKTATVTLKATPAEGYKFLYWEDDQTNTNPVREVTIESGMADMTYKAVFAEITYNVTFVEGTNLNEWSATPNKEVKKDTKVDIKYTGTKKVIDVKVEKKATVDPAKAYLKWDADQKKLVATEIPAEATKVENSTSYVEWSGTYVVEGNVTITGNITLSGNVNLIIKDGATLTAKKIIGYNNNLSIYGQANQTGQLVVDNSGDDAITSMKTLEVHSAKLTATTSYSDRGAFCLIGTFNVYGGSVDATATGSHGGYGIWLGTDGSMNIYGGEVKAVGKGTGSYSYGITANNSSTVTVNGGKLWAENADKKALRDVNIQKGAGFSGKIEYSSDKSTWSETVDADAKYVRAGY